MKAWGYAGLCLAALIILPWDFGIIPGPMPRDTTSTAADEPHDTAAYSRRVLMFPCSGVKCQAWLYMPKNTEEKPPVLLAAHGVGCQKDFALAHYGDRFAKAGFATFIFDYRTFGGSEGEPRHWASPSRHLDDYISAFEYIKTQLADEVDVNRINLWGTSFSGGHVLTLAGSRLRNNITSVVAQVPFTDGIAFLVDNWQRRPLVVVRSILAGLHDALRGVFNYPAAYIPLAGERGGFSLLDVDQADSTAFFALHPKERQGGWRNMVRARIALESLYSPIRHIPKIKVPVLYLAAANDKILPLRQVTEALNRTPDGRMYTVKAGHFSVYSGLPFPYLVQHTVGFLRDTNGMERIIMSAAEAAGLGRPAPHLEHRTVEPSPQEQALPEPVPQQPPPQERTPQVVSQEEGDDSQEERESLLETAAEL